MNTESLREQLRKDREAERKKELGMPINQIHTKAFYRIPISEINPYHERELANTTYVLGSPGSGKSRLLIRLRDEGSSPILGKSP